MTMIDEKLVEAAQKATTTRIDLVSGYYLFQHKPTDMTCSIHAPDGLHIGNLLANEAGDFAAEITSLRAELAAAKPVAGNAVVWRAAEAVFAADHINHSMVPFAEQPAEVHDRYKRLALAALAIAKPVAEPVVGRRCDTLAAAQELSP